MINSGGTSPFSSSMTALGIETLEKHSANNFKASIFDKKMSGLVLETTFMLIEIQASLQLPYLLTLTHHLR